MPTLSVFLLGPLQVLRGERTLTNFEYDKVRALLAYLATEADRPHRREMLMGFLWPELPEPTARTNLRQALATLRRALHEREAPVPYILATRDAVQWVAAEHHELDVATFSALLDECQRHLHRNAQSCRACAARLEAAVNLYRGPFLAQFSLGDCGAFEEWVLLKREWLHSRLLGALVWLAAYYARRGDYARAIEFARRQLEQDSWREEAHRQLMTLLVLTGERSAALAQYERCRRLLAEGMGVEPETETTALYVQIREGAPDALVDLRHLKAVPPQVHNLPPALTPLVGREAELAAVSALLAGPTCRLVTLVGMGGIGKTRLALQVAWEQLHTFTDGVFWVPLGGMDAPERLPRVVGEAMGLVFTGMGSAEDTLLAQLRHREALVVLDNFEHLLAAAPFIARLLFAAQEVSVLVTAREPLRLQGEWLVELSGLALPARDAPPHEWEQSSAVQLFLRSAQRAGAQPTLDAPERAAIGRICALLDGLPLGLELAGAWSHLLSADEIAHEMERDLTFLTSPLQDLPVRHRSLAAVLEHAWALLSAEQQRVLRALSLFRGGFRREAAEQVAGASLPLLAALRTKSLLRRDAGGRYDLHELVRQYARRQLEQTGELAAGQRAHLAYMLALAERAEAYYSGAQQGLWLSRIAAEHDNLTGALDAALQSGEAEKGLRLAVALYRYWHWRTYVDEGRHWLEATLRATNATDEAARLLRARALHAAGVLSAEQGERVAALTFLDEALALRRALGDRAGEAASLNSLGVIAWEQGDYDRAQLALEASLRLRRALGQRDALSSSLNNLGLVALARQDFAAARTAFEEVVALDREAGNQIGIAGALVNLGTLLLDCGEAQGALPYFRESLALYVSLAERDGVAYCLEGIAGSLSARSDGIAGRYAALLFGAAETIRAALNMPLSSREVARVERHRVATRAQLGEPNFGEAWAYGRALTFDAAVAAARRAATV